MPSSTQIDISVNGHDNASKVLGNVRAQLDGLTQKVSAAGQIGKQATSVASAGFQAMNGTLTGAISGARGMASAIQAMGVAMNTAMPIAAAASAAIAGIAYAVGQMRKAQEEAARAIEDQNHALLKQADAIESVARARERQLAHERKMIELQRRIDLPDKVTMANQDVRIARKALDELETKRKEIERFIEDAEAAMAENVEKTTRKTTVTFESPTTGRIMRTEERYAFSQKERDAAQKAIDETTKKLVEERDKLDALNQAIDEQRKEIVALRVERDRVADAERKAAEEQLAAELRKEAEAWVKYEEAIESARKTAIGQLAAMAERRDAEILNYAKSTLAQTVSSAAQGAKVMGAGEMGRLGALLSSGILRAGARGYTTSQGDTLREAERQRKTEQYQNDMKKLLQQIAEKAGTTTSELGIRIEDF